ncbi:MAG: AAA family ATPase [Taibaiella sp.]|nr:AAA family ATPase [Taibaiella sp.]
MDILFKHKYKSITKFEWREIPRFVVITGPNGSGKSQLLELIYRSICANENNQQPGIEILNEIIEPHEVTFLKGEWNLRNTTHTDLSVVQSYLNAIYNQFISHQLILQNGPNVHLFNACKEVLKKVGKSNPSQVTKEEFSKFFPEVIIENEDQLSQKISEIFLHYRLSEIELQAKGHSSEEVRKNIGEKPWVVMKEIIKAAKLPFDINDPSNNGVRDSFRLVLTHETLKEEIDFQDLSSGERVLISLVFYTYNSQERSVFPKLLLLDEPDAHLHPSMSQQFLNVIKNVLVDRYGVRVIMSTHSPSTVVLAPADTIFEMQIGEPRIKKSPSKNHSISLLTSGLVYVGEGSKYVIVEDKDDVEFYSCIHGLLVSQNIICSDKPLVFIPASTKESSGGKNVVNSWVKKVQESGLRLLMGLIDRDHGNIVGQGVFRIARYSIENYLIDPIVVYGLLMDIEENPSVEGLSLTIGEEYKLKSLPVETLQKIADVIIQQVEPELKKAFKDFDLEKETERIKIEFTNGLVLMYPKWLVERRGKTLAYEVYNRAFPNVMKFDALLKTMKKVNLFPIEIVEKLREIKDSQI